MNNSISKNRIEGLDFARALAMFGMLLMNFVVVTGAKGNGSPMLVWFTNLFEGRAAATFVILAGIGISLMTRRARLTNEKALIQKTRFSLLKRSIFLFVLGMLLYTLGWAGDILHYYGVYMALATLLIMASPKIIVLLLFIFSLGAQFYQVAFDYMNGWSPTKPFLEYLDFWTVSGFLRNLFFNGFHPVFPWICFLFIGLLIGRLNLVESKIRKTILLVSSLTLIVTELLSRFLIYTFANSNVGTNSATFLFETGPIPPNLFYLLSNTASSLIIIILSMYVAEKFSHNLIIRSIIYSGQLALTHYVSHVVIGIGILLVMDRVILFNGFEHQPLSFTFLYSCLFFIGSILFSVLWRVRFKRGPIELVMRKCS
nr:heparan-alpha-glucosaminide N-acetyltransferase domain-containing protein [Alkalicoccobacillus murimartini]